MGKWILVWGIAIPDALTGLGWGDELIRIVEERNPQAVVQIPADPDDQTRLAAELLVRYVEQASGASLAIRQEGDPNDTPNQPVTIYLGPCDYVDSLNLKIDQLDDDGFVIRGVDSGHVVIAGPTAYGTEFGVCEFLERYLGVRWLLPGPNGDDVPASATVDLPLEEVRGEPAFFSRLFSGLQGNAQLTWARRNRMHGRVQFHHNLQRLFPPETYTKTHPHFFPLRNGDRYLPATNNTHGWQPCFAAEGIVDEAIKNICRYFDQNPHAPSYSLGVVDSSGHCECDDCEALDSGQENFLGRRDVSDRFYGWCNQVVEGVLKEHPGKFFGCLAYSEVAQPPSRVQVHPQIVPYMTYDRMKWIDPELRAEGHRVTKWWQEVSPVVGWYDYIYGSAYCLPRVWFYQMEDYYRFGHAHGVRALYAEAYPNWGEGPKLYVSLKLQWDPQQDVDQILDEWYVRCVGQEAAADLAAYYAHWEDFWTRRILDSDWFTRSGQYLAFHTPGYLADVTDDDLTKSRDLLERVVEKAATPDQKARARLLLFAFDYYEASAIAYSGTTKAKTAAVRTEADALELVDRGRRLLEMTRRRRRLVLEEFPKHPHLLHQIDLNRYTRLRGDDWGTGLLWRAAEWIDRSDAVASRLRELADSSDPAVALQAKTMLLLADKTLPPISKNPSLENPDDRWPNQWSPWVKWGIGTMTASPRAARTGRQGVLSKGMKRGGPNQTVDVTPGRYAATAFVRVPQAPKGSATVTLDVTPLDEQGQNLPSLSSTIQANQCDWTRLAVVGDLPAQIKGHSVSRVRLIVIVDGFQPDEEIHIDDVAMFKLP